MEVVTATKIIILRINSFVEILLFSIYYVLKTNKQYSLCLKFKVVFNSVNGKRM
jgi:hypothetical protein